MVFRAKVKKKVSRARSHRKKAFAPSRAHPAAVKAAGPELLDLLVLHFKDKGYAAKSLPPWTDGTKVMTVDVSHRLASRMACGSRAHIHFHFQRGVVYHSIRPQDPGRSNALIPLGAPEDPELVARMEGVINVFICGAECMANWIRSAL